MAQDPFSGFDKQPYSLHPYQYAYSNPILHIDPSGECVAGIDTLVCVGAGVLIVALMAAGLLSQQALEDCGYADCFDGLVNTSGMGGAIAIPRALVPDPEEVARKGLEGCLTLLIFSLNTQANLQSRVDTRTRRDDEQYITLFHYTDYASALSIQSSGNFYTARKGRYGYGMYLTQYNSETGHIYPGGIYKLSKKELQFGLRGMGEWPKQQVDAFVQVLVPLKSLTGKPGNYYRMQVHPLYPTLSAEEVVKYNSIREQLLIYYVQNNQPLPSTNFDDPVFKQYHFELKSKDVKIVRVGTSQFRDSTAK